MVFLFYFFVMKLVEFLLGTDEERAAADEINALVAQYPTWKVKDQLDALRDLTRGLVFRRTAAGMALATVLGVGAIVSSGNNKEAPDKDSIVSSAEAMESYELTLGNVTFFLKDKNSLGGKGRAELFETLKKSYDSLCDYFGDELLTFSYPLRLPIEIETNGVPIDEVESSIEMAYDKDGVPRATQRPTFVKLKIADLNEDVIAHELFHLFLQGNDVGTQAFLEGHAHVVQRKLYAAEVGRNPWDVGEIVNIPQVKEITDLGLDSYIMDRKYGGGAQSLLLERFLRSRWEGLWSDYLKIDSTFLKKFYKRLRSVREVSDKYYSPSKAELVRMGEAVSPGFEK